MPERDSTGLHATCATLEKYYYYYYSTELFHILLHDNHKPPECLNWISSVTDQHKVAQKNWACVCVKSKLWWPRDFPAAFRKSPACKMLYGVSVAEHRHFIQPWTHRPDDETRCRRHFGGGGFFSLVEQEGWSEVMSKPGERLNSCVAKPYI